MIIVFPSRYKVDNFFTYAQWLLGVCSLLFLVYFAISLFFLNKLEAPTQQLTLIKSYDANKILAGPLALLENPKSPFAYSMEQKLKLIGKGMRPDLAKNDHFFLLGIRDSALQKSIKEGEGIFLNLTRLPSGEIDQIEFSDQPTDISLSMVTFNPHCLLLKLTGVSNDPIEIALNTNNSYNNEGATDTAISSLQNGHSWGQDLFFREYGGDEYQRLGQKEQIEITEGASRYILYVGAGDYLTYREGKWEIASSLDSVDHKSPLAYIHSSYPSQLEIEAWDSGGLSVFKQTYAQEKSPPIKGVNAEFFTNAKLRSSKLVSCKINKKRTLFKEGDWLIKTQAGWHKLRSGQDIDNYLTRQMRGDLLVIDNVEANGEIRGNFFNELHTNMQPFSAKAAASKAKKVKRARNKK